jgi:Predicted transcriptional regulators
VEAHKRNPNSRYLNIQKSLDIKPWFNVILVIKDEKGIRMTWTIQEVSQQTGIPTASLRYYDRVGLLQTKRRSNGYRYYDERDIILLQYIAVMKYAHFSLSEIKAIVSTFGQEPDEECNRLTLNIIQCKQAELKERVANYNRIIKLINQTIPMIGSVEDFQKNETRVDNHIRTIFSKIDKKELD